MIGFYTASNVSNQHVGLEIFKTGRGHSFTKVKEAGCQTERVEEESIPVY